MDEQQSGKQFVSVENSMGIVHASRGVLKPASKQLLSEPAIVAKLAEATFSNKKNTNWLWYVENYDRIRDAIEKTIPGFENYNKRVRNEGGFYLPNGARDGNFKTLTGKANFTLNPLPDNQLQPGEFILMTIRSHDQFNTTIYGLDDRYRGIQNGRRVLFVNKNDLQKYNLEDGAYVDIFSNYKGEERKAPHFKLVAYNIPESCLAAYFPETNVLVPVDDVARKSHTPASKRILVTLKKRDF